VKFNFINNKYALIRIKIYKNAPNTIQFHNSYYFNLHHNNANKVLITDYSFTQYQFVNFILHTIPIHNINTFKLAQANMYHNLIYVSVSSQHSNFKKYLFNNYNNQQNNQQIQHKNNKIVSKIKR